MRRFALGLLVVLCLAATSRPSQAATVFGFIDTPPADASTVEGANSAFLVQGWAVGSAGILRVDVLVDGQVVASTNSFGQRPDIQTTFPALPDSLHSGWSVYIDSTALINGLHTISAVAVSTDGSTAVIGVRIVQVDNASLNLHPFGDLQYPVDESTVPSVCLPAQPTSVSSGPCPASPPQACQQTATGCLSVNRANLIPVVGWALDTGARSDLGQVGYVQLLIDGVIIADTRQDCVELSGAFANCYGLNRPDVERQFPGFVNSDNAGFAFDFAVLDDGTGHLGIYVPSGSGTSSTVCVRSVTTIVPGKHDISIRAGDVAETVSPIGTPISVNFTTGCRNVTSVDQPAFGNIEKPLKDQLLTGTVVVSGWAFDPDGFSCDANNSLSHVDIDVDGHYQNIVTKQPCGVPCPPGTNCPPPIDPDCQPASPGSNDETDGVQWCLVRADVVEHDIRVPGQFPFPGQHPSCVDEATWSDGQAEVGWSFSLDTTALSNAAHDLNVYASDCNGYRVLIGRVPFTVFNDPQRGSLGATPAAAAVGPVARHHP